MQAMGAICIGPPPLPPSKLTLPPVVALLPPLGAPPPTLPLPPPVLLMLVPPPLPGSAPPIAALPLAGWLQPTASSRQENPTVLRTTLDTDDERRGCFMDCLRKWPVVAQARAR